MPRNVSLSTPAVMTANRDGNYVAIRRTELNEIKDALGGIRTNLDAVANIFQNGANAFRNEAQGIEAAHRIIERFCRF